MDAVPDVLKALFERGNAMQSFWSFYISVSLALIAFFGSAQRSRKIAVIMTIAFVGFASVNGNALLQRSRERQELYLLATSGAAGTIPDKWCGLVAASKPPDPTGVMIFHVGVDLGVLVAIWLLTLGRSQSTSQATGQSGRSPAAPNT